MSDKYVNRDYRFDNDDDSILNSFSKIYQRI